MSQGLFRLRPIQSCLDYSECRIILIDALYITPFLSQRQAPPVSFVQFRMTDQAQRTVSIIIYPIIREILLTTIRVNLKTECCFYLKNNTIICATRCSKTSDADQLRARLSTSHVHAAVGLTNCVAASPCQCRIAGTAHRHTTSFCRTHQQRNGSLPVASAANAGAAELHTSNPMPSKPCSTPLRHAAPNQPNFTMRCWPHSSTRLNKSVM